MSHDAPRHGAVRRSGSTLRGAAILVGLLGLAPGLRDGPDPARLDRSAGRDALLARGPSDRHRRVPAADRADRPGPRPQPPDEPLDLEPLEADLPVARPPLGLRDGVPDRPHRQPRRRPQGRRRASPARSSPGCPSTAARRSPSARSPCTPSSSRRSPRAGRSSCRAGVWLSIHRLALVIWVMAWMHGVPGGHGHGRAGRPVRRGGRARRRRGGVPLLGQPQAEADVRDVTTGGPR